MADPRGTAWGSGKQLLASAEASLDECQVCFEQARTLLQASKAGANRATCAHDRLQQISDELVAQSHILLKLGAHVRAADQELDHLSNMQYRVVLSDLQTTLEQLQRTRVDAAIAGDEPCSLFDFVDLENVHSLTQHVQTRVAQVEAMRASSRAVVAELFGRLNGMADGAHHHKQRVISAPLTPNESSDIKALVARMSDTLLAAQGDFDRIAHHVRHGVDARGIHARVGVLPGKVRLQQDTLASVKEAHAAVEARNVEQEKLFREAVALFQEMEGTGPAIQSALSKVQDVRSRVATQRQVVEQLLDDLFRLAQWYKLFHGAYSELLVEIARRHAEQRRQQEAVHLVQLALQRMTDVEQRRRDDFFQAQGRFLPPTLCPPISEQALAFAVQPDMYVTKLPQPRNAPPADAAAPVQVMLCELPASVQRGEVRAWLEAHGCSANEVCILHSAGGDATGASSVVSACITCDNAEEAHRVRALDGEPMGDTAVNVRLML